eukprot:3955343-Pleurochrysis_carterae.AAC.1
MLFASRPTSHEGGRVGEVKGKRSFRGRTQQVHLSGAICGSPAMERHSRVMARRGRAGPAIPSRRHGRRRRRARRRRHHRRARHASH